MPVEDPYGLLGVPKEATEDDVRKAHRRLAREHHPDANPEDPAAEERFKEIQRAYKVLSNARKRREYDKSSRPRRRGSSRAATGGRSRRTTGSVDLSDLLGEFGGLCGRSRGINWQLRVEDAEGIARISRILGVDLARLSKWVGEGAQMKANVSFEEDRSGISRNTAGDARIGKPRKPTIPPKTRKPPAAWREIGRHP